MGSSLTAEGDIGEAIAHSCMKSNTAIVRLRPALVSGSIRIETKMRLVENFVRPTLLYWLETAVMSKLDFDKLSALLNNARRLILKLNSKTTEDMH